jgi:hypothetical protein
MPLLLLPSRHINSAGAGQPPCRPRTSTAAPHGSSACAPAARRRDPYIVGGQFIWGCSLNDYAGCLQDAKQGDNSRHCQWDERETLCIIDPMYTQKWILEK